MAVVHQFPETGTDNAFHSTGEQSILFPHGLIGCPDWRHFSFSESELPGVLLLSSLDDPAVCFTLFTIADVDADYRMKLDPDDAETLNALGAGEDDVELYCTLTVHDDGAVTANLLGPIVIDHRRGAATQVVVSSSSFSTRHQLYSGTE